VIPAREVAARRRRISLARKMTTSTNSPETWMLNHQQYKKTTPKSVTGVNFRTKVRRFRQQLRRRRSQAETGTKKTSQLPLPQRR